MQRDNVSQCRYCGKRIRFIRMSSGKAMPVDELLVNYRVDASGKDRIVTPNGEVVVGVANVQANDADGIGYTSHFANCPMARSARRR